MFLCFKLYKCVIALLCNSLHSLPVTPTQACVALGNGSSACQCLSQTSDAAACRASNKSHTFKQRQTLNTLILLLQFSLCHMETVTSTLTLLYVHVQTGLVSAKEQLRLSKSCAICNCMFQTRILSWTIIDVFKLIVSVASVRYHITLYMPSSSNVIISHSHHRVYGVGYISWDKLYIYIYINLYCQCWVASIPWAFLSKNQVNWQNWKTLSLVFPRGVICLSEFNMLRVWKILLVWAVLKTQTIMLLHALIVTWIWLSGSWVSKNVVWPVFFNHKQATCAASCSVLSSLKTGVCIYALDTLRLFS